jgi:hypothetical protein
MNMILDSNDHAGNIGIIATLLAAHFVKPLYNYCSEKKYHSYVNCLSEIIDWTYEFYEQYSNKLGDWENFVTSKDNIYKAADPSDFISAWGQTRISKFIAAHTIKKQRP